MLHGRFAQSLGKLGVVHRAGQHESADQRGHCHESVFVGTRLSVIGRMPGDDIDHAPARQQNEWPRRGIGMRGHDLAVIGLQLPVLNPESAMIVHARVVDRG